MRSRLFHRRGLATFAELFRRDVSNAHVRPGDPMVGRVVGTHQRGSKQRFLMVDFGLKNEAPFSSTEILGATEVGEKVSLPMVAVEDDFNEPALDYSGSTVLSEVVSEREKLWKHMDAEAANFVHGRYVSCNKGGVVVKALGSAGFSPKHHVLSLTASDNVLGSYAPFYVLRYEQSHRSSDMILSAYGGYLFALANLVGCDKAWEASGGGPPKERFAYLRLFTRILIGKNRKVRKLCHAEEGQYPPFQRSRYTNKFKPDFPSFSAPSRAGTTDPPPDPTLSLRSRKRKAAL